MRTHRRFHCATLALLSVSALTISASAQKSNAAYTFTDLGGLPGLSFKESSALGINDAGQIVGSSYTAGPQGQQEVAVLWSKDATGKYVITNLLGSALPSSSSAINSQGDVVAGGAIIRPVSANGSKVWYVDANNDGVNDLAITLGGFGGSSINDDEQMTSGSRLVQFDDLDNEIVTSLPGDGYAVGYAINNNRQVAGQSASQATIWQADAAGNVSSTTVLSPLAGNTNSSALCIDALGRVAGYSAHPISSIAQLERATLWQSGKTPTDLGAPANSGSAALGISTVNNVLQVVGFVDNHNGDKAFIWKNGRMTDLNGLISASGVTLTEASAINASGQIVGLARVTIGKQNVEVHGFLLTPK
jgi:probable HAF family extracellular repeat protein